MFPKKIKEKLLNLPDLPGVYIIKSSESKIIYIGKAKNLRKRVTQYFVQEKEHTFKVQKMVENAKDFDYIITDNEFEALILECSLIKRHMPKYNILLKDSKGYSYIKITNEPWQRVRYVKQKENDGAIYFGPYTNGFSVKQTVEEIIKIFKLPVCNRDLTKIYRRSCLNYHIDLCDAPCIGNINAKNYQNKIKEVIKFIKNGSKETVKYFTEKMQEFSENLNFEKAAEYRDKIKSIQNVKSKQKVILSEEKEQDIIAFVSDEKKISAEIFRFENGELYETENFIFNFFKEDMKIIRTEFMKRYYSLRGNVPKNIMIDGEIENFELIIKWLESLAQKSVRISIPKKGQNLELLEMCKKNAEDAVLRTKIYENKTEKILKQLQIILNLKSIPKKIEAYDISNLQGTDNVGGMVVFEDGVPLKKAYRQFKIKTVLGQDDYGSIKEVIERRINNFIRKTDENFAVLADLILIDGGQKQVSAVKNILKVLEIEVPVFGMVKDKKHRTRALTTESKEIEIKPINAVFSLITRIQNEVHRFAISYHKNLRSKRMKASNL